MQKKYNYVYKITNKNNGMIYIGKHSTNELDDGYWCSGVLIQKAIFEEGLDNFFREIICFFDTEEEAFDYERQLVTINEVNNPLYYNCCVGGDLTDGFSHLGLKRSDETKKKQSERKKKFIEKNGTESFGKGCIYIHNIETKEIKRHNKDLPIPDGFAKGSGKTNLKNTIHIYCELTNEERTIKSTDKIPDGWSKGRVNYRNNKTIYNPSTNKIKKIKKDDEIPDGWVLGSGGIYSVTKNKKWRVNEYGKREWY